MTRPCETCAHYDIDPLAAAPVCEVGMTFAAVLRERTDAAACGPEGRWWEPKPRKIDAKPLAGFAGRQKLRTATDVASTSQRASAVNFQKAGAMPFDATNGLYDLGADAGVWAPPSGAPLALAGMRASLAKAALSTALALLAWVVLFGAGCGLVALGWMLGQWVGV